MSRRDWTFRIRDMLDAAEKMERYTDGFTYEEFVKEPPHSSSRFRTLPRSSLGRVSRKVTQRGYL